MTDSETGGDFIRTADTSVFALQTQVDKIQKALDALYVTVNAHTAKLNTPATYRFSDAAIAKLASHGIHGVS